MKKYAKGTIEKLEDYQIVAGIASSGSTDRDGEIIDPNGWDLKSFKDGGPLLWSHDAWSLPIGRVTKVWRKDDILKFNAIFAVEENEFARQVFDMYKGGFITGVSVGFRPLEMDGSTYTKTELLEISLVNVPANPDARVSREYKAFQEKVEKEGKLDITETEKAIVRTAIESMNTAKAALQDILSCKSCPAPKIKKVESPSAIRQKRTDQALRIIKHATEYLQRVEKGK